MDPKTVGLTSDQSNSWQPSTMMVVRRSSESVGMTVRSEKRPPFM